MNVLALDTATRTGWARLAPDGAVSSGVWEFPTSLDGAHFAAFRDQLSTARRQWGIARVVYERPGNFKSAAAAAVCCGLIATLLVWCLDNGVEAEPVAPQTVKKNLTGKGNANKDLVLARAVRKWPDQDITDNNQADALAVLDWVRGRR